MFPERACWLETSWLEMGFSYEKRGNRAATSDFNVVYEEKKRIDLKIWEILDLFDS